MCNDFLSFFLSRKLKILSEMPPWLLNDEAVVSDKYKYLCTTDIRSWAIKVCLRKLRK